MGVRKKKASVLDSKADFICINLGSRGEAAQIAWTIKKHFPDVYKAYATDISTHNFGSLHGGYMVCDREDAADDKYIVILYCVVADVNGGVRVDPAAFKSALSSVKENILVGWQRHYENPITAAIEVPSQKDELVPVLSEVCASLPGGIKVFD